MQSPTHPTALSAPRSSSNADPVNDGPVPLNRYVAFFLIATLGCAIDLLTKSWIFAKLGMPLESPSIWLWDKGFNFGFTTSLNEGALFGVGQGQVVLFTVMSVIAAVGVLYWLFVVRAANSWLLTVALGCVTAGILGNLYDRLGLHELRWNLAGRLHNVGDPVYAVRDWLHFKIDAIGFDFPIFNIADSLLVYGAGLLIWHAFFVEVQALNATADKPSQSSPAS